MDEGCYLEFKSKTLTGQTSVQENFRQDVDVSLSGFGAAFKASTQYKSMTKEIDTTEKVYTSS